MIDNYCERTGPEFWSEPINALTNLSFIIAAILVFRIIAKKNIKSLDVYLFGFSFLSIGIGSFLFHTFATRWAELADVIPILIFQVLYLWFYSKNIMQLSPLKSSLFLSSFFIISFFIGTLPPLLNGSIIYAPAILYLLILSIYHVATNKKRKYTLLASSIIFIFSLTFRSIDMMFCDHLPFGTHFMWHLLNGVMLYMIVIGYVENRLEGSNN